MWKNKPTIIEEWIDGATHVAFFDENGDSDMGHIIKSKTKSKSIDELSSCFNLTSVLLEHDDMEKVAYDMVLLKNKYWPEDGCFLYKGNDYKKVCFHSREIRRQTGPFSKNILKDNGFMEDLNSYMESLPISITSCFIDKVRLYEKYGSFSQSPYNIAITFVLERLIIWQLKDTDRVIIILESRGRREDLIILDAIVRLMNFGTQYATPKQFAKIIGVYFNPKRSPEDCKKSYYGLEIADLCAYPIYKFCRSGVSDKSYNIIKSKIHGYPKVIGYGLKKFPK